MITTGLVFRLGLSQFLCWGISYYLIGVFGEAIARDTGWSLTLTYSGFSGALVIMGLTSSFVGRLVDRHGGRRVMTGGSALMAVSFLGLSLSRNLVVYDIAWAFMGLAMRMTLYEAAFATLAHLGGASARRPISQITLLGGLASTAFWPIGHMLETVLGWRGALVCYAVVAVLTIPLHWSIPDHRRRQPATAGPSSSIRPLARSRPDRIAASLLYMIMVTAAAFVNSGISAHMIGIMSGIGLGMAAAVWLSALRGIGQSSARLVEILFGRRLHPLSLGVVATALLPLSFAAGLSSGGSILAAVAFALCYGAGNGLLTIVRGTQPLVLFDNSHYGLLMGRLTAPGFFVSALAPIVYASIIEISGAAAALHVSLVLAILVMASAAALRWRFRKQIAAAA
ncbi:MFS transporter [Mesorhizobium sp. RMAD-H1]|uniref:MFS transporter n=1 Tax=Mesorhizobium sp. RMAD-H1 TaxID=2587065 RepID=UPI00160B5436|nr:MFS transporter [Mesorhizobium sp. RMAD-H1]MBB2971375.1 MFS family permease [Mesorhizobium sp. RMAD-H1]